LCSNSVLWRLPKMKFEKISYAGSCKRERVKLVWGRGCGPNSVAIFAASSNFGQLRHVSHFIYVSRSRSRQIRSIETALRSALLSLILLDVTWIREVIIFPPSTCILPKDFENTSRPGLTRRSTTSSYGYG
jgi:hypothetical protein